MLATGFAIEMSFVAIGWQVYAVHSNPLDLGLVGLAMFIPLPLLALPAGHLADRFPRRTLLAIATALDVAVMVGLLFVTRAGAASTWPFFVLAFGTGVASALGAPASRALTPSLVPREILVRALALRSIVFQASVIIGPAIGGLLFAIALRARLRGGGGAVGPLPRRVAVPPRRARFGRWLVARPRERARRRAPRAPDARAARRHLARPLRRPVRRRGRAAARLRQGRARRRAGRPGRAPGRSCCRRAVLGDHPVALARAPARRPDSCSRSSASTGVSIVVFGLSHDDVALAARARGRRRRSTW